MGNFFEQKCTYSFAQNVSLPNQNFVLQNFELQNLQDFVLQIQSGKVLIYKKGSDHPLKKDFFFTERY